MTPGGGESQVVPRHGCSTQYDLLETKVPPLPPPSLQGRSPINANSPVGSSQ